jgi:hypothetical protein
MPRLKQLLREASSAMTEQIEILQRPEHEHGLVPAQVS